MSFDKSPAVCLAKTSYTHKRNDLEQSSIRSFPIDSGYDRFAPTSPRLDGQRFQFPGGPRPRKSSLRQQLPALRAQRPGRRLTALHKLFWVFENVCHILV